MTMMKPDERRAMRRQQIEQFLASDTGVMEWTKLNRMSTSTFYLSGAASPRAAGGSS